MSKITASVLSVKASTDSFLLVRGFSILKFYLSLCWCLGIVMNWVSQKGPLYNCFFFNFILKFFQIGQFDFFYQGLNQQLSNRIKSLNTYIHGNFILLFRKSHLGKVQVFSQHFVVLFWSIICQTLFLCLVFKSWWASFAILNVWEAPHYPQLNAFFEHLILIVLKNGSSSNSRMSVWENIEIVSKSVSFTNNCSSIDQFFFRHVIEKIQFSRVNFLCALFAVSKQNLSLKLINFSN